MNEFTYYRLLTENASLNTDIDALCESVRQDAIITSRDINHILFEAQLSGQQTTKLFKAISAIRGDGKGLATKGKKGLDKASQVSKDVQAKVQSALKSAKAKAEQSPVGKKVSDAIAKGGEKAKSAIDFVDNKVDDAIVDVESKLRQSGPAGEKAVDAVRQIGNLARKNPKTAGFALAALTAIGTMATGGVAGPALGLAARSALEMAKGEKLSTAVGKGIKTAAIGGAIGVGADMIGDVAGDISADFQFEPPELDFSDIPGTDLIRLDMTGNINNYYYDHTILADEADIERIQSLNNEVNQLETFSDEWYKKQGEYLRTLAEIEASPNQTERWDQYEQASEQKAELKSQYEEDITKYEENTAEAQEVAKQFAQAVGVAGAGAAGAADSGRDDKRERATEDIDLERIKALAGLNEAGMGDMVKKAGGALAQGAKKVGKKAAQKVGHATGISDREPIDVPTITQAWKQGGSPLESDQITKILKQLGFTSGEIKKAYKQAGIALDKKDQAKLAQQDKKEKAKQAGKAGNGVPSSGTDGRSSPAGSSTSGIVTDEQVLKLAGIIKSAKLEREVIDHLSTQYQITESFVFEDVVVEKLLSDKLIKQVIVKLVKNANIGKGGGAEAQKSAGNINSYVKKLKSEIDQAKSGEIPVGTEQDGYVWKGKQWVGKNGQMAKKEIAQQLNQKAQSGGANVIRDRVKEIVTFMADWKGQPEWDNAMKTVQTIIQDSGLDPKMVGSAIARLEQGKTMERKMYNFINKLLEHVGVSMLDLGIKAYKLTESRVVFCKSRKVDSNSVIGLLETLKPPLGRIKKR